VSENQTLTPIRAAIWRASVVFPLPGAPMMCTRRHAAGAVIG